MGMYILVGVLALIVGIALGFFIARKYMTVSYTHLRAHET